jgi:2-hydroxy-3-keto-5-methylthiopentenyl-1-phosphate phosphatase
VTRPISAREERSEEAGIVPAPTTVLVIDFDGTITERDTLELIVDEFGDPDVRRRTEARLGSSLSLQEVIAAQYGSVRAPLAEVVAWTLRIVRFRPGLQELVGQGAARGWQTTVVSWGLREVIEPLLAREGFESLDIVANSVEPDPAGWRVRFRDVEACSVCGETCKRSAVSRLAEGGSLIYVGDGYSDGCAAEAADRIFARRRLITYLEERGLAFERFEDLLDIARRLRGDD